MVVKRFNFNELPEENVRDFLAELYPDPAFRPQPNCKSYHQDYFKTWICVFQDESCCGKIALFENPEIAELNLKTLIAGYFDAIDSDEVMRSINQELSDYCKENGYERVIGPLNVSTWENYRFLKNGDQPPFFMDVIHPVYYHELWSRNGWEVTDSYHSTEADIKETVSDIDPDLQFHNEEVEVVPFNLDRFEEEIRAIYDLCTISFKNNRYYSPISFVDFLNKYQKAKSFINPEYVLVAKHHSKTVGFIFCVPDILNPQKKRLIVKTLAILPDRQYRGLGSFLTKLMTLKAATSFEKIIHALMYDSNKSANILASHHTTIQQYSLFEWDI
jgi:L-amino acid N-acyltransferase YncA